jgi:hypothetical protein
MSRSTLALTVGGTMILLLSLATAARAGGPLGPRRSSDLIQLLDSGLPCPIGGSALSLLLKPDGSISGFTIPTGQVLVVTGIAFEASAGAGDIVDFSLSREGVSVVSVIARVRAIVDADGETVTRVSLDSGAAVNSGTLICSDAHDTTTPSNLTRSGAYVYGYLTNR